MIEPLRYNRELAPTLAIARPVFCEICKTKKDTAIRRNPNVAVKYCPECTKNFMCFGCDEDLHRLSPANLHVRKILVIGPGVRKKVVFRGDRVTYPQPLDTVSLKFNAYIVHKGKVIHREPIKTAKFMCGLSGNSVHVQVLGARNLVAADKNGTSDPFITGSFCGVTLGATRIRPRSLNPGWDSETFVVPLADREPRRMAKAQKNIFKLEVFDFDWTNVNDFLGHVEMSTDRLSKLAEVSDGQPLCLPLSLRSLHGTLDITLGFCRDYLHFKVVKAECLDKVDPILLSDPYAVVYFGNKRIGRTPVVRNTINPLWEKGNVFRVPINDFLKRERTLIVRGKTLAKARQKIKDERERRREEAVLAAKRELLEDEESQKNGGRPAVNWLNPVSVMEYFKSLGKKQDKSDGERGSAEEKEQQTKPLLSSKNDLNGIDKSDLVGISDDMQWKDNPLVHGHIETGTGTEDTLKKKRRRRKKKSDAENGNDSDGQTGKLAIEAELDAGLSSGVDDGTDTEKNMHGGDGVKSFMQPTSANALRVDNFEDANENKGLPIIGAVTATTGAALEAAPESSAPQTPPRDETNDSSLQPMSVNTNSDKYFPSSGSNAASAVQYSLITTESLATHTALTRTVSNVSLVNAGLMPADDGSYVDTSASAVQQDQQQLAMTSDLDAENREALAYADNNNLIADAEQFDKLEQGSMKSSKSSKSKKSQKPPGFTSISEEIKRRLAEQEAAQKKEAAEKAEQRKRDEQKREIIEYRKSLRALLNYGHESDEEDGDEETKIEESMTLEELQELANRSKQGVEGQELPLFRIELFDGNPYRRRVHLGTARVDLRCVRRMLPAFPVLRLVDEEEYDDKEEEEVEIQPQIEPSSSPDAATTEGAGGGTTASKKSKNVLVIKKYRRKHATPHDPPSFRQFVKRAPRRAVNYCLKTCCGSKNGLSPSASEKRRTFFSLRAGAEDEAWEGGVEEACVNDDMSYLDTPGYLTPMLLKDAQQRIEDEKAARKLRDATRLREQEEERLRQRELFLEMERQRELEEKTRNEARAKKDAAATAARAKSAAGAKPTAGTDGTTVVDPKKQQDGDDDSKSSSGSSGSNEENGSDNDNDKDDDDSDGSSRKSSSDASGEDGKSDQEQQRTEKPTPKRMRAGTVAHFNPLKAGRDMLDDSDEDEDDDGSENKKGKGLSAVAATAYNADDDRSVGSVEEEHVLTDAPTHHQPSIHKNQESTPEKNSEGSGDALEDGFQAGITTASDKDEDSSALPPVSMDVWGDSPPAPSTMSPSKRLQLQHRDDGNMSDQVKPPTAVVVPPEKETAEEHLDQMSAAASVTGPVEKVSSQFGEDKADAADSSTEKTPLVQTTNAGDFSVAPTEGEGEEGRNYSPLTKQALSEQKPSTATTAAPSRRSSVSSAASGPRSLGRVMSFTRSFMRRGSQQGTAPEDDKTTREEEKEKEKETQSRTEQKTEPSGKSKRVVTGRVRFWDESAPLEFMDQSSRFPVGKGKRGDDGTEKGRSEAARLLQLKRAHDDATRKKTIVNMVSLFFRALAHRSIRGTKRSVLRSLHFVKKQSVRSYRASGRMYLRQKRRFAKSKLGRWLLPRIQAFHRKMAPVYRATAAAKRRLGVARRFFTAQAVGTARRLGLDKYFFFRGAPVADKEKPGSAKKNGDSDSSSEDDDDENSGSDESSEKSESSEDDDKTCDKEKASMKKKKQKKITEPQKGRSQIPKRSVDPGADGDGLDEDVAETEGAKSGDDEVHSSNVASSEEGRVEGSSDHQPVSGGGTSSSDQKEGQEGDSDAEEEEESADALGDIQQPFFASLHDSLSADGDDDTRLGSIRVRESDTTSGDLPASALTSERTPLNLQRDSYDVASVSVSLNADPSASASMAESLTAPAELVPTEDELLVDVVVPTDNDAPDATCLNSKDSQDRTNAVVATSEATVAVDGEVYVPSHPSESPYNADAAEVRHTLHDLINQILVSHGQEADPYPYMDSGYYGYGDGQGQGQGQGHYDYANEGYHYSDAYKATEEESAYVDTQQQDTRADAHSDDDDEFESLRASRKLAQQQQQAAGNEDDDDDEESDEDDDAGGEQDHSDAEIDEDGNNEDQNIVVPETATAQGDEHTEGVDGGDNNEEADEEAEAEEASSSGSESGSSSGSSGSGSEGSSSDESSSSGDDSESGSGTGTDDDDEEEEEEDSIFEKEVGEEDEVPLRIMITDIYDEIALRLENRRLQTHMRLKALRFWFDIPTKADLAEELALNPITWSRARHFAVNQQAPNGITAKPDVQERGQVVVRLLPATRGTVIRGLDEAVMHMSLGETATIKIRFDQAYGHYCIGSSIPPRANIVFTAELTGINDLDQYGLVYRNLLRVRRFCVRSWILFKRAIEKLRTGKRGFKDSGEETQGLLDDADSSGRSGSTFYEESTGDDSEEGSSSDSEEEDEWHSRKKSGKKIDMDGLEVGMRKQLTSAVKLGGKVFWGYNPKPRRKKTKKERREEKRRREAEQMRIRAELGDDFELTRSMKAGDGDSLRDDEERRSVSTMDTKSLLGAMHTANSAYFSRKMLGNAYEGDNQDIAAAGGGRSDKSGSGVAASGRYVGAWFSTKLRDKKTLRENYAEDDDAASALSDPDSPAKLRGNMIKLKGAKSSKSFSKSFAAMFGRGSK